MPGRDSAGTLILLVAISGGCREPSTSAPPSPSSRTAELEATRDRLVVGNRPTLAGPFERLWLGPGDVAILSGSDLWNPDRDPEAPARWVELPDYSGARFQVAAPHGILHAQINLP